MGVDPDLRRGHAVGLWYLPARIVAAFIGLGSVAVFARRHTGYATAATGVAGILAGFLYSPLGLRRPGAHRPGLRRKRARVAAAGRNAMAGGRYLATPGTDPQWLRACNLGSAFWSIDNQWHRDRVDLNYRHMPTMPGPSAAEPGTGQALTTQ